MAAKQNSTLTMAALGIGGFLLWRKFEDDKAAAAAPAPVTVTPTPAAPLAPVINITIPSSALQPGTTTTPTTPVTPTTPLQPVINLNPPAPPATTPTVIQTDYGPVIPLQPATTPVNTPTVYTPMQACKLTNPTWTDSQCNQRLVEIPMRHQYIVNSILDGRNKQGLIPNNTTGAGAAAVADIQGRLDILATKDAALQAEWRQLNGGYSIPEGLLSNPTWKASYIAFLNAQSPKWSDFIVGVINA